MMRLWFAILGGTAMLAEPALAATGSDGQALYQRYCALCHGADREGHAADHAPSLRSPELLGAADPGFLWSAIAFGRPGTAMAAFSKDQGGPLSHETQHALFDWLLQESGVESRPIPDQPVEGDVQVGAKVYAEHCASCHGVEGEGGTGTALGNPVFLATASDAFIRHTIREGRSGVPMPGFAGTLPDSSIDAVVAFLRSRAVGWHAPAPVRVSPPDPSAAVLHPEARPAALQHRKGRFVSAASVAAAFARGERMVVLDARPLSDWQRSHIPGALPVPFYDGVERIVAHLPGDKTPIVVYCACPHAASGKIVDELKAKGFQHARILDEGILHWAAKGYPVALGSSR
jgi:cytochrome c oxidase cbb3-type subunit III